MSEKKTCWDCKHFTWKLMLNGYHGVCEIEERLKHMSDTCEKHKCEGGEDE